MGKTTPETIQIVAAGGGVIVDARQRTAADSSESQPLQGTQEVTGLLYATCTRPYARVGPISSSPYGMRLDWLQPLYSLTGGNRRSSVDADGTCQVVDARIRAIDGR